MTAVATEKAFKSRWGYHPCDGEEFQKIRRLYKFYWIARYSEAAWHRWNNKHPHNRLIKRKVKGVRGSCQEILGPAPEPFFPKEYQNILKEDIPALYERARRPLQDPSMVQPLHLSPAQINLWLEKLSQF